MVMCIFIFQSGMKPIDHEKIIASGKELVFLERSVSYASKTKIHT